MLRRAGWCRGRGNAGRTVRIDAPRDEMKNEMTIYYRIAATKYATKMGTGGTDVMCCSVVVPDSAVNFRMIFVFYYSY